MIGDFVPGTDKLKLVGVGYGSFAELNGFIAQAGDMVVIDLDPFNAERTDFVLLHNVTIASLSAGDFIFW